MNLRVFFIATFTILLSGCAGPLKSLVSTSTGSEESLKFAQVEISKLQSEISLLKDNNKAPATSRVDLTKFIDFFNLWNQGNQSEAVNTVGLYSRLRLESKLAKKTDVEGKANEAVRPWSNEKRSWLERFIAGKDVTRVVTIKAAVQESSFTAAWTLVDLGHISNRELGEQFDTNVQESGIQNPFFEFLLRQYLVYRSVRSRQQLFPVPPLRRYLRSQRQLGRQPPPKPHC